jgi:metallophosphoesterase (TIGR00282 family)
MQNPGSKFRILFLGDVFGKPGRKCIETGLASFREREEVDLCIVNGENCAGGNGITPKIAEQLFRAGADIITTGDHIWDRSEIEDYLDSHPYILRPLNFVKDAPGKGTAVWESTGKTVIGIVNLIGRVFMKPSDSPFYAAEQAVEELSSCTAIIVDFHAEATSEKIAMGKFLDGKVSAVLGTHTHVQTADACILPKGTAYITDVGMTGPSDSVIGLNSEEIITNYRHQVKRRFSPASEGLRMEGVIVDVDTETGKAVSITPVKEMCGE